MLFFDWSKDPLFFEQSGQIQQIQNAQAEAIQRIQKEVLIGSIPRIKKKEITAEIMNEFLANSGIIQAVFDSFGIPWNQ